MLEKVTITGADDNTSIYMLRELSAEFPFVEWGILVSRKQEGHSRFPSRHWIDGLAAACAHMNVSMHVCGAWVRELLIGQLDWAELPSVAEVCQRIQINTHAEVHPSTTGLWKNMRKLPKEFIFQWDGVNDHLTYAAAGASHAPKVAVLFDTSGGAGALPASWRDPIPNFHCGYAGGLGPDNVVENLHKIEQVCRVYYWIDMERRVRTPDDSLLDIKAVRRVLESSAKFMAESGQLIKGY